MSYDVGTHIDLTWLNTSTRASQKKSTPQTAGWLYDVGTQFVFQVTAHGFRAALKIPVAMA